MTHRIDLEGFEGQNIEIKPPGFFSGIKLSVNGKPAPKGQKRGQMILRKDDGTEVIATWKANVMGLDVPSLVVGEKIINVIEPLKWYELVWSGLPILLVFMGGVLGAVAGFIGFSVNTKVFRSEQNSAIKYALTAGISIAVVVVYLVLAIIFSIIINS